MKDKLPRSRPASQGVTKSADVDGFLDALSQVPSRPARSTRGRLLFGLDATASREATWDQACHIQMDMFGQAEKVGGLEVQVCYFQGFKRFFATRWVADPQRLQTSMAKVRCQGGLTQIERVLDHCISQTKEGTCLLYTSPSPRD